MNKNELKQLVIDRIDARRERLIALAEQVLHNPELAYCEKKTSNLVREVFEELQLPVRDGLAITGLRADLDSGRRGIWGAVLGELDGLLVPSHLYADPETGAAHACGHHAGLCAMLGAAMALAAPEVMAELSGGVAFIATPSEECQNLDYLSELKQQGKIHFYGGKSQLIYEGVFDDVDISMMVHSDLTPAATPGYNGFVMKKITFRGLAAHAGLQAFRGVNALSMLRSTLNLIDAQRDTFRDEDSVRIHGFIPNGGIAVNVVPETAGLTLQVRGKTPDAVEDAASKVDRCAKAAAMAFGGDVEIDNLFGFMPLQVYPELDAVHRANLRLTGNQTKLPDGNHRGSSTDMGDVSMLMPVLHASTGGFTGSAHGPDYVVCDTEAAYILPAKLLAMNVIDLLYDQGEKGREIISRKAPMTKAEYIRTMEKFSSRCHYGTANTSVL